MIDVGAKSVCFAYDEYSIHEQVVNANLKL